VLLATLGGAGLLLGARLLTEARRAGSLQARRALAGAAAILLLVVAFVSPLATLAAHYLLTAHLVQVTLTMGFVPPLLLLALPPAPWGRWPRALRVAGACVVHPASAIVLVNVVFFGWHAPVLYDACLAHPELYSLQQTTLLLVSIAFWWPIIQPCGVTRWSLGPLVKLGYILLATIPQTFAGLVFALAHRPFYSGYDAAAAGVSPLSDQQVAGACMALLSKLALFAAFSVVVWRMFEPMEYDSDRGDEGGRGGDYGDDRPAPVQPGAPAWYRMLDTGPTVDEPAPEPAVEREPASVG